MLISRAVKTYGMALGALTLGWRLYYKVPYAECCTFAVLMQTGLEQLQAPIPGYSPFWASAQEITNSALDSSTFNSASFTSMSKKGANV